MLFTFHSSPVAPNIWFNLPLCAWRYFSVHLSTTIHHDSCLQLDKLPADYLTRTDCLDHPTIKLLYICTQHPQEITLCNRDESKVILNQIIRKMYFMNGLKSYLGCPLPWGHRAPDFCRMSWVLPPAKQGLSAPSDARGDTVVLSGLC